MITGWADDKRGPEGGNAGYANAAPGAPFAGRRVVVVGLARSGRAAVDLLLTLGADVAATDARAAHELDLGVDAWPEGAVDLVLGGHPSALLEGTDIVVVSPGVPSDAPFVVEAAQRGVKVIGELELAYRASVGTWLAVTGTNGKTTTTALLGAIVKAIGKPTLVAGNIGVALSSGITGLSPDTYVVAEVSSFQLDTIELFRPKVAVLLNITEDHLDRYSSSAAYAEAKRRIFENQDHDDFAVVNVDDPGAAAAARGLRASVIPVSTVREVENGVFVRSGEVVSRVGGSERTVVRASEIGIPGPHNLANAVAAVAAAAAVGALPEAAADVLRSFTPLPHRLEPVADIGGVTYVNDSKATNVDSVSYALRSFDRPLVLIAGGKDKGADFGVLVDLLRERARAVVLLGEAADLMQEAFKELPNVRRAGSLHEAIRTASELAEAGDVVLLSPACASFDMFKDFEERGACFRHEVGLLASERARGGGKGPE